VPEEVPVAAPAPASVSADQRELDQARRQSAVMQEELEALRTRVKELEEDSKKWRQLAGRDTVTGLPNKTMLFRLVIPKILRELDKVGPLSCIAISFEHVGQVNQQHGWLMGDRMLKESAANLRKYVQEGEELYRLDGVHFAIVGPMNQNAAKARATEMRRRLAQANVQVEKTQLPMVASLAVVTIEKASAPPAEVTSALYAALLTTLYKAKEKGGNTVEVHVTTRF
jgi:diguanylate cyclase (GGDEF)-like protein